MLPSDAGGSAQSGAFWRALLSTCTLACASAPAMHLFYRVKGTLALPRITRLLRLPCIGLPDSHCLP